MLKISYVPRQLTELEELRGKEKSKKSKEMKSGFV